MQTFVVENTHGFVKKAYLPNESRSGIHVIETDEGRFPVLTIFASGVIPGFIAYNKINYMHRSWKMAKKKKSKAQGPPVTIG